MNCTNAVQFGLKQPRVNKETILHAAAKSFISSRNTATQTIRQTKILSACHVTTTKIEKLSFTCDLATLPALSIKWCATSPAFHAQILFDTMFVDCFFFAETFRSFFCWDMSVICLTVV